MSILNDYYNRNNLSLESDYVDDETMDVFDDQDADMTEDSELSPAFKLIEDTENDSDAIEDMERTKETMESLISILKESRSVGGVSLESAKLLNTTLLHVSKSLGLKDDFFTISEESNYEGLVSVESNIAKCEQILAVSEEGIASSIASFLKGTLNFFSTMEKIHTRLHKDIMKTKNRISGVSASYPEGKMVTISSNLIYNNKADSASIIEGVRSSLDLFNATNSTTDSILEFANKLAASVNEETKDVFFDEYKYDKLFNRLKEHTNKPIIGNRYLDFKVDKKKLNIYKNKGTSISLKVNVLNITECNQLLEIISNISTEINTFLTMKKEISKLNKLEGYPKTTAAGFIVGMVIYGAVGYHIIGAIVEGLILMTIVHIFRAIRKSGKQISNLLPFTKRLSLLNLYMGNSVLNYINKSLDQY